MCVSVFGPLVHEVDVEKVKWRADGRRKPAIVACNLSSSTSTVTGSIRKARVRVVQLCCVPYADGRASCHNAVRALAGLGLLVNRDGHDVSTLFAQDEGEVISTFFLSGRAEDGENGREGVHL